MWPPQTVLGTLCPFLHICFWGIIQKVIWSPWRLPRYMAILLAQRSWLRTCLHTTRENHLVSNPKLPLSPHRIVFLQMFNIIVWWAHCISYSIWLCLYIAYLNTTIYRCSYFLLSNCAYALFLCIISVLYLLANPGGITIFGWIVDRAFLNTILMLELTLVLFVLSKTVVIPGKTLMHSYIGFPWLQGHRNARIQTFRVS